MQVCVLLVLLSTLAARPAYADTPATLPVAVAPGGGQHNGIQLRSQTVDVSITEEGGQVWADTRVWMRLSNPAADAVGVDLALPGPAIEALGKYISPTLPADLELTIEDEPQTLEAAKGGLVAPLEIRGQGQVSVRVNYRQALPERDGLVLFAYPLSVADKWSGTPESLRVSVKFGGLLPAEQLLGQAPMADNYDGQVVTWEWSEASVKDDVWLAFIAPSLWADLAAARAAATRPDAGLAQQIALSQLYQRLAALPRLPFSSEVDFYSRYYPAAVGALQTAISSAGPGTTEAASPEVAAVHGMLARLYRQQADRLGENAGFLYLQLAANEAQAGLAAGVADPTLHALAAEAYRQLATRAAAAGDDRTATDYLARLAALEPAAKGGASEQQRAARLQVAMQQAAHGELANARRTVAETLGQDAVELSAARAPLARQAVLSSETRPDQRTLRLTLGDFREPVAVSALLDRAAGDLRVVPGARVSYGSDWLALTLPYAHLSDLAGLQAKAAAALPPDAELALLAAALRGDETTLRVDKSAYRRHALYSQRVDLQSAREAWEQLAATLEAAAQAAEQKAGTGNGTPDAQLARLQHTLWTADAAAWRALLEASRAEYRVNLAGAGLSRSWVVPGGAARTLTAESSDWRYEYLLASGAAGAMLLALVAFALWRWL